VNVIIVIIKALLSIACCFDHLCKMINNTDKFTIPEFLTTDVY